jgi:hypothetical protein
MIRSMMQRKSFEDLDLQAKAMKDKYCIKVVGMPNKVLKQESIILKVPSFYLQIGHAACFTS